jgi:hypothetical protein
MEGNMYTNFSKYSEALKSLLKEVFVGDVILEPVDTAFKYAIEQTNNNLKFPFISFYPDNSIMIDAKNNSMPSYTVGMPYENPITVYNEDGSIKGENKRLSKNTQFLYIIIGYQLDIWGTTRQDTEEVMQELLFWLYQNQEIKLDYEGNQLYFTFTLGNEIIDNSDLVSYTTNGKLYRYTYPIQVQAALTRSENYFTVLKPNIKIEKL